MSNNLNDQKIAAITIPAMISNLIHAELKKVGSFLNGSLAYWGIDVKYKIEIILYSRGDEKIVAEGEQKFGPMTSEEFTIEGEKRAGRKSKHSTSQLDK